MLGALAAIFGIPVNFIHPGSQLDEVDREKGTGRGAASGLFLYPVPPPLSLPTTQTCEYRRRLRGRTVAQLTILGACLVNGIAHENPATGLRRGRTMDPCDP